MAHEPHKGCIRCHCCTPIENKLTENVFVAARVCIFLGSNHWSLLAVYIGTDVIFCLFFSLARILLTWCNCPKWNTWLSIYFSNVFSFGWLANDKRYVLHISALIKWRLLFFKGKTKRTKELGTGLIINKAIKMKGENYDISKKNSLKHFIFKQTY